MATRERTPDAELLLRLRERDRAAWEELYAVQGPRLRGFAYRLAGNPHDADDLVQETFVRALPLLDRLDPETADVGAYLFATLKNLFLKQVERGRRQQPVADVPEPVGPTPIDDDPERSALLQRQQHEVRLANMRLDPRQRLVLALRELEERSYAEIGEVVGLKENAVAQLIFRARESLRIEVRLAQVSPEHFPEACRRFLPLLAAHLDGELRGKRLDETLAHLEACERCQSALADMREASRRYRTLLLPLGGADEARAAVEERLELVGYWRRRGRGGRLGRGSRLVVAACAALTLGGGGAALGVGLTREARPATGDTAARAAAIAPRASTTGRAASTSATGAAAAAPATAPAPTPQPRPPAKAPKPATPVLPTEGTESTPAPPGEPRPEAPAITAPAPVSTPAPEPVPAPKPKPTPKPVPKPKPAAKPKPAPPAAPTPAAPSPPAETTAPLVTITDGPAAVTAAPTALLAFTANEQGATFRCSLDGAEYVPCSSPAELAGLVPGAHTFRVRAVDKAGNVGKPAVATWTYAVPDTTAPVVTITAAPPATTADMSATIAFEADDPAAAFACSLDGAPFAGCASPAEVSGLAPGVHSFAVRATDAAGNTSVDAVAGWEIVAPPPPAPPALPDLVVAALSRNGVVVANRGDAAAGRSVLTITLVGSFDVPELAPGASATFRWSTCSAGTYSAVADRTQLVVESDEGNNTAALRNSCP